MSCSWLRWAFNTKLWSPTAAEWTRACNCVQKDEINRIDRFVFKAPAISAMVGRLMLRKGIAVVTGWKNSDIRLTRTEEGRPLLEGKREDFDFNISHHGDWVVLALESLSQVGIDIMSLDRPINTDLDEYFRLMRRQFTDEEWSQINAASSSLHEFYRFWCLKESFVKAVGVGLNVNLQTISFLTKDPLHLSEITRSTKLVKAGSDSTDNWTFEETLLDYNHCVAVCWEVPATNCEHDRVFNTETVKLVSDEQRPFSIVTIADLLDLSPLGNETNESIWNNFNNKDYSAH